MATSKKLHADTVDRNGAADDDDDADDVAANSNESDADAPILNLEVTSKQAFYTIPRSCCVHTVDEAQCDRARVLPIASPIDGQTLHLHGCTEKLVGAFQENLSLLFAVALCIVAIELLGLIFALWLCCSINSSDYK